MSSLGIYFGPKEISIVENKGKKVARQITIPQVAAAGELEEKAPAEAKMIELVALLKDELRRAKIETREAALCLSGQDLIIRTFEIPQMPREEMAAAINFEAKKYIPFKIDELITDFQVVADRISRTNQVLFMGIRRDTFERYVALLGQLNLKISDIEYSAFSVLRSLSVCKLSTDGIIGVIAADLVKDDEVNFTVIENGFPLFSRDITLAGGPAEAEKAPGEPGMSLEKLKTEIRISLDYYNRKFPTKNIKRVYLICNDDFRFELETFLTQIGPFVQFVDISRNIEGAPPFSLAFVKGFCASLAKTLKTNIKTNLLTAKERVVAVREKPITVEAAPLLEGIKVDMKMVLLGILICVATYILGIYRMQPINKEISDLVSKRPKVALVKPDASYEVLSAKQSEFKKKLDALNDLVKKQLYVTKPLNVVPRAIPEGVWLTKFSFDRKEKSRAELRLEGVCYLGDSDAEFEAVNEFVSRLKGNAEFSEYFKSINVSSINRAETAKLTATNFSVSCRNY